jgi:radical SAM protein with 4Fe4S-binding SPASM domain
MQDNLILSYGLGGGKVHWSKFVHIIEIENRKYLFHAVNKKLFTLTEGIPELSASERMPNIDYLRDGLSILLKNGFILESEENENLLERSESPQTRLENLRILVTNECNLNCLYCQIERNMSVQSPMGMSTDTAKDIIDWFSEKCSKKNQPSITITGGEPFVNYETVKFIIKYASEKCPFARIVLFTNGTLITEESARFLKDNNVFVIISIDGPEEVHNKSRQTLNGSNSLDMTMSGYQKLKKANVKLGISAVMPESYGDFQRMINYFCSLKPLSVGINYKHQLLDSCFGLDFQEHGKRIVQAYEFFSRTGIYFENYERYRKSFISSNLRTRECQSCGRGVTVDARGYIGTCKSLLVSDLNYCSFKEFDYSKSQMVLDWASRTPLVDEDCKSCYAISICGGGCAYDSYVLHNRNYKVCDKRICPFMRQVMESLLLNSIKQSNDSNFSIIKNIEDNFIDPIIQSVGH